MDNNFKSDMVKHELRVESLKARVEVQKHELKFKSTSYELKSTSYKFKFTSYKLESKSYEFKFTSSRIIKSLNIKALIKNSSN